MGKNSRPTTVAGSLKEFVHEEMAGLVCFPSFCLGQVREETNGICLLEVDTESHSLALCCSTVETYRCGADWRMRECLEELDLSALLWTA